MADTANKVQLGVLLSKEADGLLRALHARKAEEAGLPIALSAYVEWLVKQEAQRQGIKPAAGKPKRSKHDG